MALSNMGLLGMAGAMLRPGGNLGDGFLGYNQGAQQDANMQATLAYRQAQQRAAQVAEEEHRLKLEQARQLQKNKEAFRSMWNMPPQPPGSVPAGDLGSGTYGLSPDPALKSLVMPQSRPQLTPQRMQQGLDSGYTVEQIKAMVEASTLGMPEVARTIEQADSMGRPQTAQFDKFGRPVGQAMPKPYTKSFQDMGDTVQPVDPYMAAFVGNSMPKSDMNKLMVPGPDGRPMVNQPLVRAKQQVAAAGATKIDLGLTKGQTKVDEGYAKEFTDFELGGASDAVKQISQLRQARDKLKKGAVRTGPVAGALPDWAGSFFAPQNVALREQVEEVVQRNLRTVLGAQFTEKEGERLIARAFNPRLGPQANIERLDRLILQMEQATESKRAASEYFKANGTLRGWEGKLPSISDFDMPEDDSSAAQGGMPSLSDIDAAIAKKLGGGR